MTIFHPVLWHFHLKMTLSGYVFRVAGNVEISRIRNFSRNGTSFSITGTIILFGNTTFASVICIRKSNAVRNKTFSDLNSNVSVSNGSCASLLWRLRTSLSFSLFGLALHQNMINCRCWPMPSVLSLQTSIIFEKSVYLRPLSQLQLSPLLDTVPVVALFCNCARDGGLDMLKHKITIPGGRNPANYNINL